MNKEDAFYFAIDRILDLKNDDVDFKIIPYNNPNNIRDATENEIPKKLWCRINFKIKEKSDIQKINELGDYLGMCGISFDIGGCKNSRDWEFDWSFEYKKGEENWEWRTTREDVEKMIDDML
ncbi:MAG TPA: hypothetical protein ENH06_00580 [bacterium]|nr:hypothetical protein [bacterium]